MIQKKSVLTGLVLLTCNNTNLSFAQLSGQSFKDKTAPIIEIGSSTNSELAWLKKVEPFEAMAITVVKKLKIGDVDWIVNNTEPLSYGRLGKDRFRHIVATDMVPYFKDFARPAEDLTVCVAKCKYDRGFSFYDFFESSDKKKKPFMIEISRHNNQLRIYSIIVGLRFKDEYPNGNEKIVVFRRQNANAFMEK